MPDSKKITFIKAPCLVESIAQHEFPDEGLQKPKILLVEDEPSNILVASVFLENLGYDFDVARDGREAIRKIKELSYGLILMDINMPLLDGYMVTRKLRRLEAKGIISRARIIAMTAHALADDRNKCLDAGMNDYISKPFTQSELHKKIEHNLSMISAMARLK